MCLNVCLHVYLELWIAWSFAQRRSARAALCWDVTETGGIPVLVLHLIPCTSTGCRAEQLGSSFVERAQGLLVGTTLTMSQQCVLEASSLGGCVGQSFASRSRPPLQLCPLLGSSVHKTWMLCREGHHNHQVSGAPVEWGEAEQAGTVQPGEEKVLGIFSVPKYLMERYKGGRQTLLRVVSDRAGGSASGWSNKNPPFFDYTVRAVRHQNRLSTDVMECPALVMLRTWMCVALGNLV